MDWSQYRQRYLEVGLAFVQTRMIGLSASEAFVDFPDRLPGSVRDDARVAIARASAGLEKQLADAIVDPEDASSALEADIDTSPTSKEDPQWEGFGRLALTRFALIHFLGEEHPRLDFEYSFRAQCLVMLIASLEGFLADSVRAACHAEPRLLKSRQNKKVEWGAVVDAEDKRALLEHLVERFLDDDFKPGPLSSRLTQLRNDFGLGLNVGAEELDVIRRAEQIRHALVHNSGRVDRTFLDAVPNTPLGEGDLIPLSGQFVDHVGAALGVVSSEVFFGISEKFFGIDPDEVASIFRFSRTPTTD